MIVFCQFFLIHGLMMVFYQFLLIHWLVMVFNHFLLIHRLMMVFCQFSNKNADCNALCQIIACTKSYKSLYHFKFHLVQTFFFKKTLWICITHPIKHKFCLQFSSNGDAKLSPFHMQSVSKVSDCFMLSVNIFLSPYLQLHDLYTIIFRHEV